MLSSIALDSMSLLLTHVDCEIGSCSWADVPERVPFLALLGTLLILYMFLFMAMVKKEYAELWQKGQVQGSRGLGGGGGRDD